MGDLSGAEDGVEFPDVPALGRLADVQVTDLVDGLLVVRSLTPHAEVFSDGGPVGLERFVSFGACRTGGDRLDDGRDVGRTSGGPVVEHLDGFVDGEAVGDELGDVGGGMSALGPDLLSSVVYHVFVGHCGPPCRGMVRGAATVWRAGRRGSPPVSSGCCVLWRVLDGAGDARLPEVGGGGEQGGGLAGAHLRVDESELSHVPSLW